MNHKISKYHILRLFTTFFLFVSINLLSQFDSIQSLVNKEGIIAKKIKILLNASDNFSGKEIALTTAQQAYQFSLKESDDDLIARSSFRIGKELFLQQKNDSVLYYNNIAGQIFRNSKNSNDLYDVLFLKFKFYKDLGQKEKAFQIYKELIEFAEKINDPVKVAEVYYGMGSLFYDLDDFEKSINFFEKSLKIFLKEKYQKGIIKTYRRLGEANSWKGNYDIAIECFERGYKLDSESSNKMGFLTGIGNVYYQLFNYEKALKYYKDALLEDEKKGGNNSVVLKNNIGASLLELKRYKEAKPYFIEVYFSKCSPRDRADFASNLSAIYQNLGEYEQAMSYLEVYVRMNDSLNTILYQENLSETEAKYRNEKQEEQNILLSDRIKQKSLQFYYSLAGILLLSGLVFFIFRGLRQKNKANLALEEKNKIIEEKSIIVEEQHKDITDSIKYAQRIQQAILPPDKLWNDILPQSFVFYQPKDILSGDFYWIEETPEFIFIAAADCTGHGVPGALMSIVNYNLLNKAVLEQGLTSAGAILDSVNKYLTLSLHQTYQESAVRDGMDVSLCVINKATKKMNFAGAFNSIYIIQGNEIKELIPDKQPVGAFIEDNFKPFKNQYYQLMENDIVYMFTDGYADQFGGVKGKKYKYKNLQNLLLEVHQKPFLEQKMIIEKTINIWKGPLEQVDDILILGYKLI